MHDDKVVPLTTELPLGHHLAFVFNENKSVLAAQYDMRALPLSRVNRYLNLFPPNAWYLFTPLVRKDMWDRFMSGPPRKLKFTVAEPETLADVGGAHKSVYENVAEMARTYGPHLMEISMSMGQAKGSLRKAREMAKELLRLNDQGEIDLRNLKGKAAEQPDEIDLLGEILTEKITLDLPKNDPKKSYDIRLQALHAGMKRNAAKF